jgi:hypothetical protein
MPWHAAGWCGSTGARHRPTTCWPFTLPWLEASKGDASVWVGDVREVYDGASRYNVAPLSRAPAGVRQRPHRRLPTPGRHPAHRRKESWSQTAGRFALRIVRACHEDGIEAVAVYSDADRTSPHVQAADRAVHIGPAPAAESYLNVARLLEAAASSGATRSTRSTVSCRAGPRSPTR